MDDVGGVNFVYKEGGINKVMYSETIVGDGMILGFSS